MIETRTLQPSTSLQSIVHHYWILKSSGENFSSLILPMGCMKWMFHRKSPFVVNGSLDKGEVATVCGQYDKAIKVETSQDLEMICVFFQPYASKLVMGMPCDELFGANVDFDSLEIIGLKDLKRQVLNAETDEECIKCIEDTILQMVVSNQNNPYIKQLASVFDQMNSDYETHIADLASTACLGERQFRRVFSENVGISPKQALKVHRFLAAAKAIQSSASFDEVVPLLGFTDNSHFNKEFHNFVGMSPSEYVAYIEQLKKNGMMNPYKSYHDKE